MTPPIIVSTVPECAFYRRAHDSIAAESAVGARIFDADGRRLEPDGAGGLRVAAQAPTSSRRHFGTGWATWTPCESPPRIGHWRCSYVPRSTTSAMWPDTLGSVGVRILVELADGQHTIDAGQHCRRVEHTVAGQRQQHSARRLRLELGELPVSVVAHCKHL
jgi:hypothetical protein